MSKDCIMVSDRESSQTTLNDINPQENPTNGPSAIDHVFLDASDRNAGDLDSLDGEQQWMQVGRSHSGRRSQKKKLKNSASHESFHNQGSHATFNRGPSSSVHSVPGGFRQENEFHLNGHAVRTEAETAVTEHFRMEATCRQESSGSDKLYSSSVSSGVHNIPDFHDDKQPYRSQSRYHRGRSSFRYTNNNLDHPAATPASSGASFRGGPMYNNSIRPCHGRGLRHPAPPTTSSDPVWRKPSHSLPFPSRNPKYSSNVAPFRPPMNNFRYRTPLSTTNSSEEATVGMATSVISSSITPNPVTDGGSNVTTMANDQTTTNQRKVTWAAKVAAAAKPERVDLNTNGTCANQSHQMTTTIFLQNQWRLFCEQQQKS